MKKFFVILAIIAVFPPTAAPFLSAGEESDVQNIDDLKKSAPRVYLDGYRLDTDYIKTQIEFVNYVRDRKEADVHVLISQQGTGSGGSEYTLSFIGLGSYDGLKNELKYFSNKIDTPDDTRKGLVQSLKLGLAPYVARTPIAQILNLTFAGKVKQTPVSDAWNYWVFSLSFRARLDGEESYTSDSLSGNFTVNRVTPQSRFRLGLSAYQEKSQYDYDDYQETSRSLFRSIDGLYVFSLGDHWSVGAYMNLNRSTYNNIHLGVSFHPAVEYNFFRYSESTRRQLRLLYRAGYNRDEYMEMTVFDKMSEKTMSHALSATFEARDQWGSAEISAEAASLWRDFSANHLKIMGFLNIRVFRGLSLTLDGRYALLNDQLSLRKSEVSVEELLLKRTELASGFDYRLSVGFSYSFGSVYSNVVNPRFGGGYGGFDTY